MKKNSGTGLRNSQGFTLIEIMVALAVVAIVFVSFYKLFSQAISADGAARFYTVAPLLAQQKMDEINGGIISATDGETGAFENHAEYTWQARITDLTSESLGKAVSDLKQVDIIISGQDDTRNFSLRSYVFLRDG